MQVVPMAATVDAMEELRRVGGVHGALALLCGSRIEARPAMAALLVLATACDRNVARAVLVSPRLPSAALLLLPGAGTDARVRMQV